MSKQTGCYLFFKYNRGLPWQESLAQLKAQHDEAKELLKALAAFLGPPLPIPRPALRSHSLPCLVVALWQPSPASRIPSRHASALTLRLYAKTLRRAPQRFCARTARAAGEDPNSADPDAIFRTLCVVLEAVKVERSASKAHGETHQLDHAPVRRCSI